MTKTIYKMFYRDVDIEINKNKSIIEINPDLPKEYFKVGDIIEHPIYKTKYAIVCISSEHPRTYLKDGKLNIKYHLYDIYQDGYDVWIYHDSIIKNKYEKIGECENV